MPPFTLKDLDNFTDDEMKELWVAATQGLFERYGFAYIISVLGMAQNKYMGDAWDSVETKEVDVVVDMLNL